MKIKRLVAACFLIMISATGCVDVTPKIPQGRWENESHNMYIEIAQELETPVSGFADKFADIGEITNEDDSTTKIHFKAIHGSFSIYEYKADWKYTPEDELFYGEYKLKGDTLTLRCGDGTEIVLTKVSEIPESS